MSAEDPYRVPKALRDRFDRIAALTDDFAAEHLNEEFAGVCRRMAAALARKRPSPLGGGQPRTWAAGILYAVGWVNFLSDPSQELHMTTAELAEKAGVGQSTIAAQFRKIRDALDLGRFHPEWTLPSRMQDNPLAWILLVDGLPVDVRREPREVQEEAFRLGLIPFVPAADPPPAERGTRPGPPGLDGRTGDPGPVYQLRIELEEVRPAIWRRVLVPADATLAGLHRVIQAAMGWQDAHLWRFQARGVEYSEGALEGSRSASGTRLQDVARPGDVLRYEYDFGDSWEHRVRVEKALPAEPGREYPVCVAGERACPPEDCGGPPGYEHLLDVLSDPADPEHEDLLEWVGGEFDPEAVELRAINRRLARTRPREGGGGGADPGGLVSLRQGAEAALREAAEALQQIMAENPAATLGELNALLGSAAGSFNARPQADLGGLSPAEAQRLLDADWEGAGSAVRLNEALTLDDLASSRTLHDARLFLEILGTQGEVKATPKGNLPRAFVAAFRERMREPAPAGRDWLSGRKIVNEEDVMALHLTRILLELGGLVKRRKGLFSMTRAGEKLAGDEAAGKLFATLFRTHFRRFNLAYLDGVQPVPALQHTVAFSLYRFGRGGGDWKRPEELSGEMVLPAVREELPEDPHFDRVSLITETRVLRPLEGFGLAESKELPREPGQWRDPRAYRKTPLFDRFLGFEL